MQTVAVHVEWESATDTDSRDNNHGDVRSQTALSTFHDSINI